MTPDELFLDLLCYHGDLIKLGSFSAYADKIKAAAAYVNRVLPAELNLKLGQKCMVLVDQINAETNVKSHHVSTYSAVERYGLQHNKRKAGGVILSEQPKRLRYDSGIEQQPNLNEIEDEQRYYDENENELEMDGLSPSLQAIKELEDVTLAEPKNVNAWMELHARLLVSSLPRSTELGLACLSEALNFNPTSARLWTNYLRLFYKSQNVENNEELLKVTEFCEEHVELDPEFWTVYVNLSKSIIVKGQILEKYISRLLQADEENEEKAFEVQLTNAILHRVHLLHLESSVEEAAEFVLGFITVYDFCNVSRLTLWLTWLSLKVDSKVPDDFSTVKIDLKREITLFTTAISHFDPSVFPFFSSNGSNSYQLDQCDFETITSAIDEMANEWKREDTAERLLLQAVEIVHRSSKVDYASQIAQKIRSPNFYALAIYLDSETVQIDEESLNEPSLSFILSYQIAREERKECSFLEGAISKFYKGQVSNFDVLALYRRLLQVTLPNKERV